MFSEIRTNFMRFVLMERLDADQRGPGPPEVESPQHREIAPLAVNAQQIHDFARKPAPVKYAHEGLCGHRDTARILQPWQYGKSTAQKPVVLATLRRKKFVAFCAIGECRTNIHIIRTMHPKSSNGLLGCVDVDSRPTH